MRRKLSWKTSLNLLRSGRHLLHLGAVDGRFAGPMSQALSETPPAVVLTKGFCHWEPVVLSISHHAQKHGGWKG